MAQAPAVGSVLFISMDDTSPPSLVNDEQHVEQPYDIIREQPSPMISDSGETSSERGNMMIQQLLAASSASASATTNNDKSPSQKSGVVAHEDDDLDIFVPTGTAAPQNSNHSGGRPHHHHHHHHQAGTTTTVNGRSPRLQGQTGALLNRADPLLLSSSGPTTALNIMRRSGRNNSDTTGSGSGGGASLEGVPRSVVTTSVSPPSAVEAATIGKSMTPVISNVDSRRGGGTTTTTSTTTNHNHNDGGGDRIIDPRRNGNNNVIGMPPNTSKIMDYQQQPSQIPGAGAGYHQYTTAHDIHRARWEQEQRELAADYYPSVNNYPFDYYNSPGRYYQQQQQQQQQLNQPPPASLRYHQQQQQHQQQMTSDATNAVTDRLALEHRLQVEQHLQEYYQPNLAHQVPPSMVGFPHQAAQAAQYQHQQQRVGQNEGGGALLLDSKPPARSGSPGVSSLQRYQVHMQLQRSGSPGLSSQHRNEVYHRRNHFQQQQPPPPPHAYEERDWRTNQVWREDDHSHTANLGGPKIPTPPHHAASSTDQHTHSDKPNDDLPSSESMPPSRNQQQQQQQQQQNPQGRVSGSMNTIGQYDITHAQIYGHSPYVQDHQQQQQQPPPYAATPSPPPASLPPPSTPMMTGIDPRIQHQMNLMAMMFQHQQQQQGNGGIPPPHISPIPRGLMYPPQYYPPQHNFYQGGVTSAVGQHPPMPLEVVVPAPSTAEADNTAASLYRGPSEPIDAPPPMPRDKSLKKKVSFSQLQIRTYETILGDNPSCTGGPSLSLGWRYSPEHFHSSVDEYERKQDELYGGPEIRPLDIDLVLHRSEREAILLKMGYNQQDLAEAVRRLNKAKSRRRQTVHNLPVMFLEEKAESCKRSLGRVFLNRQRTRHMYDEWKKSDSVHERGDKGSHNERRRNSM